MQPWTPRDREGEFDRNWVRVSQEVERCWSDAAIAVELRQLADDIRRESFLAVSRATGHHEFAGYVSDDFELIVRGRPCRVERSISRRIVAFL